MMRERNRILLQIALFVITCITTTMAGAQMVYAPADPNNLDFTWNDFFKGLEFSIPFLLFLTAHEFGHYFVAIYHKVKTSLPYYIPFPPMFLMTGTLGAVIRLRSKPASNIQSFDIGIAGPLAGFVVAIGILFYGFSTLPATDDIFRIHPEYKEYGLDYSKHVYEPEFYSKQKGEVNDITIGTNLLFAFFGKFVGDPSRVPNPHELMHYPVLLAGFLALFFTCLNLLPIGQLDGGHVVYGLFGYKKHKIIATVFLVLLLMYGGMGLEYINPKLPPLDFILGMLIYPLFLYTALTGLKLSRRDTAMYALLIFAMHFLMTTYFPQVKGNLTWLIFGFITGRFIGVAYPQSEIEKPLDPGRVTLGWIALIVFVLCFSLSPIDSVLFNAKQ